MTKESEFKIGIIESNIQTAISISTALEFRGFRTFQAYSIDDGIKLTKSEKPDLLIVDFVMLGERGNSFILSMPHQKIILMSVYEMDELQTNRFKNIVGTLKKPIDDDELINLVKEVLGFSAKRLKPILAV
jgi:DNA-binding response OmpR family regulator